MLVQQEQRQVSMEEDTSSYKIGKLQKSVLFSLISFFNLF